MARAASQMLMRVIGAPPLAMGNLCLQPGAGHGDPAQRLPGWTRRLRFRPGLCANRVRALSWRQDRRENILVLWFARPERTVLPYPDGN
jgi:hypothetical protein